MVTYARHLWVLIVIFILDIGVVFPQDFHFTNYNYTHGLNLSNIQSFCLDSAGFLWMGSNGGLAKFDGIEFYDYDSDISDNTTLPGTYITEIICTSSGKIVIACDYDGIVIYDDHNDCFRSVPSPDGYLFKSTAAVGLRVLNDSITFIRTSFGEPYLLNTNNEQITRINTNEVIRDVVPSIDNPIILYGVGNHLFKINLTNEHIEHLIKHKGFEIDIDQEGILWTKDYNNSISRYDPKSNDVNQIFVPGQHDINRSMMMNDHEVWVSKSVGCFIYNKRTNEWSTIQSESPQINDLPSSNCSGLFKDKNNKIWIGHQEGMSLIDPEDQYFKTINQKEVIKYASATKLDESNVFLSSFYQNRIEVLNTKTNSITTIWEPGDSYKQRGAGLVRKFKDEYYVEFHNGIYKTDSSFKSFTEELTGKDYLYFSNNQDDEIWVLDKKNRKVFSFFTNIVRYFPELDQDESYSAISMREDSTVWVGSSKAIYVIDKSNQINKIPIEPSGDNVVPRKIRQFHFQDSLIWIIKDREALWKTVYKNKKLNILDSYTGNDGIGSNRVTDIDEDSKGRIIISTIGGLSIYNPDMNRFINYDKDDGLKDKELIHGMDIIDDIAFVFGEGIQYVNTNDLKSLHVAPRVKVIAVLVNQQKSTTAQLQKLRHYQNNINIQFSALQLGSPRDLQYRYRLNDDKEWNYLESKQTTIQLDDLAPGTYDLQIQTSYKLSNWSNPTTVKIKILKAFWNTWWFYSLVFLVVAFVWWTITRRRETQIKLIAGMKTKMAELKNEALRAQMNPHFIFNSLNSIKSFIINEEKEYAADYLTSFSELIRLVLSNSRNKIIPLKKEIEALKLYMDIENIRLSNRFAYSWNIDENINLDKSGIPPLSLQPFVENAIWHGFVHKKEKGNLKISISKPNGTLEIIIEDDGIGRVRSAEIEKKHERRKSFGILLTSKRLKMNADNSTDRNIKIVDLYDNAGHACGTKIEIIIPHIQL